MGAEAFVVKQWNEEKTVCAYRIRLATKEYGSECGVVRCMQSGRRESGDPAGNPAVTRYEE
ncbi:Uncharacterized protein ToN1_42820 [Aromatoleum petrolei]|nr:Uncharacterized protein ToN1_42820 [Aromatoleum petrolei]